MAVDYRTLLEDVIRGAICDHDVPALPLAIGESGEAVDSSREELELFFRLVDEVMVELGKQRPSILREITLLASWQIARSEPYWF